jgi:hypothetical protein
LTSAVTIFSVLDPVRVQEDFATLELLSGRAELIVGRRAFTEPLHAVMERPSPNATAPSEQVQLHL